jgi:hypothetical protein
LSGRDDSAKPDDDGSGGAIVLGLAKAAKATEE